MPDYNDRFDAEMMALTALATGSADGLIEDAEARGQQALVNSADLPSRGSYGRPLDKALIEEKTGILFGDEVNDLFVRATLPAGWKKEGSDHAMWSYLLDDKGRRRASIFYKAAFYDRSAHISFETFWNVKSHHGDNDEFSCWVENADGERFAEQGTVTHPGHDAPSETKRSHYDQTQAMQDACRAWLDENKPGWEDPFAYWV